MVAFIIIRKMWPHPYKFSMNFMLDLVGIGLVFFLSGGIFLNLPHSYRPNCCTKRYPATKCALTEHITFLHHRIRLDPNGVYSRTISAKEEKFLN